MPLVTAKEIRLLRERKTEEDWLRSRIAEATNETSTRYRKRLEIVKPMTGRFIANLCSRVGYLFIYVDIINHGPQLRWC